MLPGKFATWQERGKVTTEGQGEVTTTRQVKVSGQGKSAVHEKVHQTM
jgi:hypothetical protein